MRPSFSYLDKADTKHREREAANEGRTDHWLGSFIIVRGVLDLGLSLYA